jgi:hypothetical protein
VFLTTRGGDSKDAAPTPTVQVKGEVLREPVTAPGPDPFTMPVSFTATTVAPTSVATTIASSTVSALAPTTGGTVVIASTGGGTPGLYGGTLNNAECNKEQLISFLEQNPDKAKAWAEVQEIQPNQIREYVGQLTPVLLDADTRVTNHGFLSGAAMPRQAVLQKGSAVLVDKFGEPRARCYCGNPLRAPVPQASTTSFTGPSWPAFDPANLQAVTPSPTPVDAFVLKNEDNGQGINRPAGSTGAQDAVAAAPPLLPEPKSRLAPTIPATTIATTSRTPTTVVTTRPAAIPAPNAFFQKEGALAASSTDPSFPVALATDGNAATSWFSRGSQVDGPTTTFTWTYTKDELITHVKIVSNAANSTVAFRRNYGYASVAIRVLDAAGKVDFEQIVQLPGTPDPDAVVQPGVRGRSVQLVFSGGEAPDCGGFAELEVGVTR